MIIIIFTMIFRRMTIQELLMIKFSSFLLMLEKISAGIQRQITKVTGQVRS